MNKFETLVTITTNQRLAEEKDNQLINTIPALKPRHKLRLGTIRRNNRIAGEVRQAKMDFLSEIRADIKKADPLFGMDPWEKMEFLRQQTKDNDGFDNSPCPMAERMETGVGYAVRKECSYLEELLPAMFQRALKLANGDMEKLSDVIEAREKASHGKWANNGQRVGWFADRQEMIAAEVAVE